MEIENVRAVDTVVREDNTVSDRVPSIVRSTRDNRELHIVRMESLY